MERMEKSLSEWIEDNVQKNMPLNGPLIPAEPMHIYAHLAGEGGTSMSDAGVSDVGTSGPNPF